MGSQPLLVPPPPPRDFVLIFSASMFFFLMCFNKFGPRLQSLWIMFFFLLEWSEKPDAGHNP